MTARRRGSSGHQKTSEVRPRFRAVVYTPDNERADALIVRLIQFGEARWTFLRGLDERPFVLHHMYERRKKAKSHGGGIADRVYSRVSSRER